MALTTGRSRHLAARRYREAGRSGRTDGRDAWPLAMLEAVFHSSTAGPDGRPPRGRWPAYLKMAEGLEQGIYTVGTAAYTPAPAPERRPANLAQLEAVYAAYVGAVNDRQGWLRWQAWNWLRAQGEPEPRFDVEAVHRVMDLAAPSLRILVECGDSDPARVLAALEARACAAFAVFPFSTGEPYRVFVFHRLTGE